MNKKLRIAVDFDGTLCGYAFPEVSVEGSIIGVVGVVKSILPPNSSSI